MRCDDVLFRIGELLEEHDVVTREPARIDFNLDVDGTVQGLRHELRRAHDRKPIIACKWISRSLVHEHREELVGVVRR